MNTCEWGKIVKKCRNVGKEMKHLEKKNKPAQNFQPQVSQPLTWN